MRDLAESWIKYLTGKAPEENSLVRHARRELELIGEEPEVIKGYLKVIQAFTEMGHSGESAMIALRVLFDLLNHRNLSPITQDPDEWMFIEKNLWQNTRAPEAFSQDGGGHYYLVGDPVPRTLKRSAPKPRSGEELKGEIPTVENVLPQFASPSDARGYLEEMNFALGHAESKVEADLIRTHIQSAKSYLAGCDEPV